MFPTRSPLGPHVSLIVALALLSACDTGHYEEERGEWIPEEVWSGTALRVALETADEAAADTVGVSVIDQDLFSETFHATMSIWDSDPDPCNLWWLADEGAPCFFMTRAEGIKAPGLLDTKARVVGFTLPNLGNCELAGPLVEESWVAYLRCGDEGRLYYRALLEKGGRYVP